MIRRHRIFMTCFLGAGAFALTLLMLVYLTIPELPGMGLRSMDIAALMLGDLAKAALELITLVLICALGAAMMSRILITQEHQQVILRKQLFSSYANLQQAQDELRTFKEALQQATIVASDMRARLRRLERGAPSESVLASGEYDIPGHTPENTHLKLTLEGVTDELSQARETLREITPSAESLEHMLTPLQTRASAAGEALAALDHLIHRLNRLVLNATLEAARFGDQGEGIIRLMDEFKMLARDTAEQASMIGEQMWHVKESLSSTRSPLSTLREDANATLRHLSEAAELLDTQWETLLAKPDMSADPAVARAVSEAAKQAETLEKNILQLVTKREAA